MKFKYLFMTIIFININVCISDDPKSDGGYGNFEVRKLEVKSCEKLMKPQPYSNVSFGTIYGKDGHPILLANITVTNDVGPLMGKIKAFKITDGKFTKILAINQANVCQYAFPLKLLPFTLKVDSKCIVKPANYINQVIDVQTMVYGFIGKKFFYGTYKVTLEWFSKKYMGLCAECVIETAPKM